MWTPKEEKAAQEAVAKDFTIKSDLRKTLFSEVICFYLLKHSLVVYMLPLSS